MDGCRRCRARRKRHLSEADIFGRDTIRNDAVEIGGVSGLARLSCPTASRCLRLRLLRWSGREASDRLLVDVAHHLEVTDYSHPHRQTSLTPSRNLSKSTMRLVRPISSRRELRPRREKSSTARLVARSRSSRKLSSRRIGRRSERAMMLPRPTDCQCVTRPRLGQISLRRLGARANRSISLLRLHFRQWSFRASRICRSVTTSLLFPRLWIPRR